MNPVHPSCARKVRCWVFSDSTRVPPGTLGPSDLLFRLTEEGPVKKFREEEEEKNNYQRAGPSDSPTGT